MFPILGLLGGCARLLPSANAPVHTAGDDSESGGEAGTVTTDAAPEVEVVGAADTAPGETELTEDLLFAEGSIQSVAISLDDAAMAGLAADPTLDVPATFTFGDQTLDVAVHLKGSHSLRTLDGKPSFKIDFDDYVPDQRFLGLEHLTLNNMVQDRSMIREHAAYWLFARFGVPAPLHGYARVSVNGEPYGLYGIVETMDQDFLKREFPGDTEGNLYETLHANGDVCDDGASYFGLQHGGDTPEGEDIAALVDTLDTATPDTFLDVLGSVFDTDEVLSFLALDIVMGHDDGYVTSRNNYLLYHAPLADTWHLVPWGQDQTFDEDSVIYGTDYQGELLIRCIASPACEAALDERLLEVADSWESADLAGYVEGVEATIEADCAADPRKEHACSPTSLLDFIAMRPDSVRAQVR